MVTIVLVCNAFVFIHCLTGVWLKICICLIVESNECSEEGACDQICTLDHRKKKSCKCAEGYRQNGSHCKAENGTSSFCLINAI